MHLPVLLIRVPHVACALFVNGALLGKSTDNPVLPVSPDGMVYITCLPIAGEVQAPVLPLTVCFSLNGGLPNAAVHGCTLYIDADGVIDVSLSLPALPHLPPDPPYMVNRAAFTWNRYPHVATLYYDNGWRVAIEDVHHDTLLLCHTIRDFSSGEVRSVCCFTAGDVLVTGEGPNGPRCLLYTPRQGSYALAIDENATCEAGNQALECTAPLFDTVGHQMRYSMTWEEDRLVRSEPVYGFFTNAITPPAMPAAACTALMDAVKLSLLEEALSYLTDELGEGMTLDDLSGFFGSFDHVHSVTGEGPCTLSLAYVSYENVYYLQSYTCEMDGLRVANILPPD